ncbi:MAG: tRNA (uridine(34)/cytosine(34)/5-carboxymethylaminomethyluridine(34)-2'-O)-methyltransferase TrmL [Pseudomonadota bacterium]|nr:tRNA (uridine(34)/cytosine(34)/5-carboxymethylaminomethyluridine(34)-2'-O)-methyltransferase TrmL [Pseudomonadota bacterium]
MLHIALYEPRIAPNTGNIIRLCANNGCSLHLIEPLGFALEDKQLKRAGLDYHDLAYVSVHRNYEEFLKAVDGQRILACTTRGSYRHDQIDYQKDDVLLFGSETTGLPESVHQRLSPGNKIRIPMQSNNRSLNLSNAAAIVSYEAWRQLGFTGGR